MRPPVSRNKQASQTMQNNPRFTDSDDHPPYSIFLNRQRVTTNQLKIQRKFAKTMKSASQTRWRELKAEPD